MALFDFLKRKRAQPAADQKVDRGILTFHNTSEVIRAENELRSRGWDIRVMGPPPQIQTGCDLVIEFPLIEQLNILRVIQEAGLEPLQVVPVSSPLLRPVDLFQVKDFGRYLMVRAANMKLAVDTKTKTIVNVSGGGCPDIPYLAEQLIGRSLAEAPQPKKIGHTLCGYALQLAYEEMVRRCSP